MNLFLTWLNVPPINTHRFVFQAAFACVAYVVGGVLLDYATTVDPFTHEHVMPDWRGFNGHPDPIDQAVYLVLLTFTIPFAALAEELVFRAPLSIVGKIFPRRSVSILFAVVLSFLFALRHGGLIGIPVQGVTGMAFSLCYLKCGGQSGKFWKPLLVSTSIHILYNGTFAILSGITVITSMMR